MRAEHDDEMRPEYDFSNGVRGKYAGRWTPEQREQLHRESSLASVRTVGGYALEQVQALEAALFTHLVLAGRQSVLSATRRTTELFQADGPGPLSEIVAGEDGAALLDEALVLRLKALAADRDWLVLPREEVYTGPGSMLPVLDRLEAIYLEAKELRKIVDGVIERHLLGDGMTRQEIERKTEETARLWLAA
jgi:hypothetical protein